MKYFIMHHPSYVYANTNMFLNKIQASNVPGRIFLFFLTGNTALMAYVPESTIGFLFKGSHQIGIIMVCIAIIGMLDTTINDMLPDAFHFSLALSIRHIALMACAMFFALCAYLTAMGTLSWIVIPYYVSCAITISVHTFFDLRRRLKWAT